MRSKIHSSFTGRELVERGPLMLTEDQALQAVGQLQSIGIGMDSALVGPAGGNLGTPAQFLQNWLPGVVRQVTKIRNADALMGVETVGSWEDEEVIQTASELTGKAELYGDVANIPLANYNATYERRSIIRFEQGVMMGALEEARAAKANISMGVEKRAAAADSLDIIRNRVAFLGYNQPDTRVFGFLNDPNLPAYVNVAAGVAGLPWSGKTFEEITRDIRVAVTALIVQSGGNIRPQAVSMTLALPLGFEEYMGVTTTANGYSVGEWLATTYPRIRVETAPELTGANGGANVMYLYAERVEDGSTDGGQVIAQIVPARFQALGTEKRAKGVVEDYTNALAGVMVKRPWAVVRYSGI
ncbi:major capsid protein [Pseudomonas phage vB_PcuM_ KLEP17-4]|nr:major capsid protein [Pseudomonas phage vB_PcuM_ KLEP17-4]